MFRYYKLRKNNKYFAIGTIIIYKSYFKYAIINGNKVKKLYDISCIRVNYISLLIEIEVKILFPIICNNLRCNKRWLKMMLKNF